MRFLAVLVLGAVLLGAAWSKYVTHDGLIEYYDKHPQDQAGATALHYLSKSQEMVSNWDRILVINKRIVERYPNSPHAMDAQFSLALALEKLNRYGEAIEEYQKFLDKYPNSRYASSVRNNIEILKSR
jgi:TolA-binding protein